MASAARSPAVSAGATAPWYFRYRVLLIAAAYAFGFVVGGTLQHSSPPTYLQLGALTPNWFGARGVLGLIVLVTFAGALLRIWGASYLSAAVVHSWDVQTRSLHVGGPYRYSRNPLYVGNLMLALAIGMYGPPLATLLVFLGNFAVVEFLIRAEEPKLLAEFGAQFAEYRARVPRLAGVSAGAPAASPAAASAAADQVRPDWGQGIRSELFGLAFVAVTVASYLAQRPTVWFFGFFALVLVAVGFARGRPAVAKRRPDGKTA